MISKTSLPKNLGYGSNKLSSGYRHIKTIGVIKASIRPR